MTTRFGFLTLFTLLLLAVMPAAAQEFCPTPAPIVCVAEPCEDIVVECQPIRPGVFTNPEWLRVDHHRVTVDIEDQIATTNVDIEFINEGDGLAEGTFVFPLPLDAAVDELIMYIDGQAIEAKILRAEEARAIYDEIVRQYRDPALLEYVDQQTIQASIFPIPPGDSRRVEISYSQVLEADNGLIQFIYPLDVTSLTSSRSVDVASISVNVVSDDKISNIYSPSHNIAINRDRDDFGFRAGFERANYVPDQDFVLYYGIASETINVNLLTYRESANEDGFFMLLVQPPVDLPDDQIIAKDVIIVLDQSGSMDGEKWDQAREATAYVLDQLNPRDRFNVVLFSTGWRLFSNQLESAGVADEAIDWVDGMFAEGGTDINGALLTALDMVDRERPTTILFLTDGLATEGVIETPDILANVERAASSNVRVFTFGVGNDVDTVLLDALVREYRGSASYVRPTERIDEEVASLYNKIGAPVLADVELDFGGVRTDTLYPRQPLPDLFAGNQLTIVGRYRDGMDNVTISLSGKVDGDTRTFSYSNLDFRDRAGGEAFIARLWATRRIGDLLNTIRINGESTELVDSVVNLSVRYGIITPYTSFLIEEDDILSQQGRAEAQANFRDQAQGLAADVSGESAVDAADAFGDFEEAEAPIVAVAPTQVAQAVPADDGTSGFDESEVLPLESDEALVDGDVGYGIAGGEGVAPGSITSETTAEAAGRRDRAPANPIQTVGSKTFLWQDGVWVDTTFEPDTMDTVKVVFLSDEYFDLRDEIPEIGDYFAIGELVIVVIDGTAYEVVPE